MAILIIDLYTLEQIPNFFIQLDSLIKDYEFEPCHVANCFEIHFHDDRFAYNEVVIVQIVNLYEGIKTMDKFTIHKITNKFLSYTINRCTK